MAKAGISRLPLLEESFETFQWSVQEGDTSTEIEKFSSGSAISRGDTGVDRASTMAFYATVWNDLVSRLVKALTQAGLDWDDTYGTAESCKMVSGQIFRAQYINAVAWNIQRWGFVQWRWATVDCPGSIGRDQFRGAASVGLSKADKLYGWHLLELIQKMNLLIEVLRGTAPMTDYASSGQSYSKALAAASKAFSAAASAHWLAQTRCPIPLATAQRVNIPLTQVRSQTEEAMALLLREKQLLGLAAVNASRGTMPMGLRFRVNTELREVSKSYLGAKLQADIYLRGNLLLGQTASSCAPIPMATAQRVNIPLTQIRAVSSGASLLVLPEPVRPEVAGQGRSYTPLDLGVRQRKNAVLAWQTKSFTAAHLRQTAAQALQPAAAKAGSDSIAEMRRCWRKAIVLPGKADSHGKQLLENAVPRSAQMRRLSEENSYDRSVMVRIPSLDTAASGNEWARWCAVLSDACAQGGEASAQEKAESINAASLKLAPMQTPEAAVQIRVRACMGVETEQRLPFGLTGKIQGQDAAWLLLVPNLLAGIATQLQSCESVVMQLKEPCVPTADGQGQTTARHSLHAAPKQTVDIATHIVTAQLASLQSKPKLKAQATAVAVDQARCEVKSLPGELMHARCTASSKAAGRLTRHPALYGEAAAVAHSGGSAEAVTFLGRLLSVSEISQSREGHTLYAGGGSALGAASAEKTGYIAQLKAAAREQLPEGCAVSAAKTACRAALELWQNTPPDTDWASQSGTVLTIQRTYYNRMDEDTPGQLLIDSAWYAEPALQAGTLAITSEGYNDYGLEGQNENKL